MTDEVPPVPEETPKQEEVPPAPKKKVYAIVKPRQWKSGAWFSQIIDPDEKEVVYECVDISSNWTLQKCIDWVESKNKNANTTTPT